MFKLNSMSKFAMHSTNSAPVYINISLFPELPVPESLWTDTTIAIQIVDTLSSVLTVMIRTLIIINTAVWPDPAWDAYTPETKNIQYMLQC